MALSAVWVVGLGVWAAFFVVAAAYLAPVFGSGWLWVGATALFCLGLPVSLGLWLVRPLRGFKKAAWFTGTFLVVPLLAVLGLSAGLRETTGIRLQRHGRPLMEHILGPVTSSDLSRRGSDLVSLWAGFLHRPAMAADPALREVAVLEERAAAASPRTRERRDLFYTGVSRPPPPRPEPSSVRGPGNQVRFLIRGGAIMVRGEAMASRAAPVDLVLDTGATLSALTPEAAHKLGLEIPTPPVQVDLDTAAGRRSFPLAVVRRLRLGRAELDHVTVAICDECAPTGLAGLLGLNFTRHFVVSIDQRRRQLTLSAQAGPRDRISDIDPFLQLSGVQGAVEGERFTVQGLVKNRGPRTVLSLRLAAELLDPKDQVVRRHETTVPKIAPGAAQPFRIEGVAHRDLVKYRLEPASARW